MTLLLSEITFILLLNWCSCLHLQISDSYIKPLIVPVTKISSNNLLRSTDALKSEPSVNFDVVNLKTSNLPSEIQPAIINDISPLSNEPLTAVATAPDPSVKHYSPISSVKSLVKNSGLRHARFLMSPKKRRLLRIISKLTNFGQEDGNDNRASKTARVISDVTGEVIGFIINRRFRAIGEYVGDIAREGVKEILISSLDSIVKNYFSHTKAAYILM